MKFIVSTLLTRKMVESNLLSVLRDNEMQKLIKKNPIRGGIIFSQRNN